MSVGDAGLADHMQAAGALTFCLEVVRDVEVARDEGCTHTHSTDDPGAQESNVEDGIKDIVK